MTTAQLPVPSTGPEAAVEFVAEHLDGLFSGPAAASERFRGGQSAADAAIAAYDVDRYANKRNEVFPPERRGASELSPYIRHNLLQLRRVWDHVGGGPGHDVRKFRDELLWQEYSRHWYARLGTRTRTGVRRELDEARDAPMDDPSEGWDRSMACMELTVGELHRDGWLVNQTRMWLSSDWSVRSGLRWQDGDDEFFRHLVDGSRAANRLGWQWTTGVGSSKHYGFSRYQVEKRAKGVCAGCDLRDDCPIQSWPDDPTFVSVQRPDDVKGTPSEFAGPEDVEARGTSGNGSDDGSSDDAGPGSEIDAVWITAESLGDDDPALTAHPDVPAVFVFDQPLLHRLQLSAKRLVFLTETLADLAERRDVEIHLGTPGQALDGRSVAVTHAPVPGFARHSAEVGPAETHPFPWLARPTTGSVSSFSAWRKGVSTPR